MSRSRYRLGAVTLQDATLPASVELSIFLVPGAPVRSVAFWLDDPERRSRARQIEMAAPYDLAGGTVARAGAISLRPGRHVVTALATRVDGTTVLSTATFTVS